ncbi:hypothetical protein GUJ93_ZPchr0005g14425 [Zizania palustris]|uniref:Uncharacterized protein n=1 Tax=Zizania palustris TaxID=103762 RepID=A0A8J5S521_ZIZPA|nr:hypothetical protein GUJ93_ZPchr0005g14425 [Zizania palustris]
MMTRAGARGSRAIPPVRPRLSPPSAAGSRIDGPDESERRSSTSHAPSAQIALSGPHRDANKQPRERGGGGTRLEPLADTRDPRGVA